MAEIKEVKRTKKVANKPKKVVEPKVEEVVEEVVERKTYRQLRNELRSLKDHI